jgi:hypothetical protein
MNQVLTTTSKQPPVFKTEYDFANDFVNQLVMDHRPAISVMLFKYRGENLDMASNEKLKFELKRIMKEQNQDFAVELGDYIVKVKNGNLQPVMTNQKIKSAKTVFNATGAIWSLGEQKYNEAIAYLKSKGYSLEDAEMIISTKGEDAPELKDWNEGKNPFNWNLAMETTGKIAQSIFYLGSIFSQKEDPAPTITEGNQNTTRSTNNLMRNILIAVIVITVVSMVAYYALKEKK